MPAGSRSDPSKRTALALATCSASLATSSFGYTAVSTPMMGEMMAPVEAHTSPAAGVVIHSTNSATPGSSVRAAMTSPPMVTASPPSMEGNGNQSIVSPISRSGFTWPIAMAPTKPPS
jgi:hypothetical protein